MPKFLICAEWKICGDVEVEAASMDEAIEKVYANDNNEFCLSAFDGEYVDDSFEVVREACEPEL